MTNPSGDFPDFIEPSQHVYTTLFDQNISGAGLQWPVGQFASVHVLLYNTDGTSLLTAGYRFEEPDVNGLIEQGVLSCNAVGTRSTCNPTWSLPVVANNIVLEGEGAATRCKLIGTSQPVRKRLGGDFAAVRVFTGTIAAGAAAGTTANLTSPAGTPVYDMPVQDCSNYNGEVMYQWRCSAGGVTGDFFMDYIDGFGNLQSVLVFQNVSTTLARLLSGHPYAFVKWRFVSNAVAPGVATPITLTIIPATPGI